jgi:hypothetical protein
VSNVVPPAAVSQTHGELLLEGMVKLEDAIVAKVKAVGFGTAVQEAAFEKEFDKYKKCKIRALAPSLSLAEHNEAMNAMNRALIKALQMAEF